MGVNKVKFGNTTIIDISSDTVTPSSLLEGFTAHDKSGALIIGTATSGSVTQDQDGFIVLPPDGGGSPSVGGLVYEAGTFTPTEDGTSYTITFSNTHSTSPYSVIIFDSGTTDMGSQATMYWNFTDYTQLGALVYSSGDSLSYARITVGNRTSTPSASHASINIADAETSESYVSSSTIFTGTNANRKYKAGRTYKWIAVWKPTT